MSEPMWKREDSTQPMPSWATYAEALNEFTKSATAFMEHVHLLTEARTAYQEAMSVGTELRKRLDAGDRTLRGLMTQLEQVVSAHMGETPRRKETGTGEERKCQNERPSRGHLEGISMK